MMARTGVSKSIVAVALAIVIVLAGAYYLASSAAGGHGQAPGSSSTIPASQTPSQTAATTTPPSTTSSTNFSGPDHQLIADFWPHTPVISQDLLLNYTMYFSAVGTVPSSLTITMNSPAAISFTPSPDIIYEPGLGPYVNVTVAMRPSPNLPVGTYPVNVIATGGGVTYNNTLEVQVVGTLIITQDTPLRYNPSTLTVPVNTTVTWMRLNPGGNNGIVAGDIGIMNFHIPSLNYTSRDLLQFQTATYTFTKPGAYPFVCDFYPQQMHGVITVTP
jgi:plastocyanin